MVAKSSISNGSMTVAGDTCPVVATVACAVDPRSLTAELALTIVAHGVREEGATEPGPRLQIQTMHLSDFRLTDDPNILRGVGRDDPRRFNATLYQFEHEALDDGYRVVITHAPTRVGLTIEATVGGSEDRLKLQCEIEAPLDWDTIVAAVRASEAYRAEEDALAQRRFAVTAVAELLLARSHISVATPERGLEYLADSLFDLLFDDVGQPLATDAPEVRQTLHRWVDGILDQQWIAEIEADNDEIADVVLGSLAPLLTDD